MAQVVRFHELGGPALGSECAGTVEAIGKGVTGFKIADRVDDYVRRVDVAEDDLGTSAVTAR